jgi:hypothetical protein
MSSPGYITNGGSIIFDGDRRQTETEDVLYSMAIEAYISIERERGREGERERGNDTHAEVCADACGACD